MSKNSNLHNAKRAKQDEFYTQWIDIEREMNAYLEYDPDVFRGKTVLLPCDDPGWSNFTKYFAERFETLGLKKLISTSYAPKANMEGAFYEVEDAVIQAAQYDAELDYERGKIFVLDGADLNGDGRVNRDDFRWEYLDGDGDFRSDEVTALRDEADMVITNPPYSLFREFVAWLIEGEVKFAVIGNFNSITYKEIFPLIQDNKMWLGQPVPRGSMWFTIPDNMVDSISKRDKTCFRIEDGRAQARRPACWFTNMEHGRRHEPLRLMSMKENRKYNKQIIANSNSYKQYDNYDAIEVPIVAGIPNDYTMEKTVTQEEYDALVAQGFRVEILSTTNGGGAAHNSDLQSGDGCADQLPGQVLSGAVRDHQVSPRQRREGSADRSSGGEAENTVLQGVDSLQDDSISVKVLNPAMGVPISFLDKYCPKQFEILGNSAELAQSFYIYGKKKSSRFYVEGKRLYDRIVIRRIVSNSSKETFMSDVNNVTWNVSIYLVRNDDDTFGVGYKSGESAEFVAEKSFTDLDEARDFAAKLATDKNETSFIEVHGSFVDGKHGVTFF